jgi:uncharacterized membrane protein YqaE (UPF0057 family)
MAYFVPAIAVFLVQVCLLLAWFRSLRKKDGQDKTLCLLGFLLGQLYWLWEVALVKQTGKPLPGSPEQAALMGRLLLGGSMGGVFTTLGLFYLSFRSFGFLKKTNKNNKK